MKKLIALTLLLCTFALLLSSCGSDVKIEKPENTNLEYWLFESPDMNDCTEIDSHHPCTESFLANGYEAIIDENGKLEKPNEAVVYDIEMYPFKDLQRGTKRIAGIEITDPDVYVWGLTIHSTREEIIEVLEKIGFTISSEIQGVSIFFRLSLDNDWSVFIKYGKFIEISCDFQYFYQL